MAERIDFPVYAHAMGKTRACRACGKRILFYEHPSTGKLMPLDVASAVKVDGQPVYRLESHFAHCSKPERFRKDAPAPKPAAASKPARQVTAAEEERRELYGRPGSDA